MTGTANQNVLKRALIVVAHPDDEFIFAHNIIQMLNRNGWLVAVLVATHAPDSSRGKEFMQSAHQLGFNPYMLGYNDSPYDKLDFSVGPQFFFDPEWWNRFDLVITHNPNGEYFHPHHMQMHEVVKEKVPADKLIYFSQNWKVADFQLHCPRKMKSNCLQIYEREAYILYNFNLITEGFCFDENIDNDLALQMLRLAKSYNKDTIGKGSI